MPPSVQRPPQQDCAPSDSNDTFHGGHDIHGMEILARDQTSELAYKASILILMSHVPGARAQVVQVQEVSTSTHS